jgi:serine/threonine-protein kinase
VNLLCPACHTPLPEAGTLVVTCPACAAEIDLSRAGTAVGRPRFVPEPDRSGQVVAGYQIGARLGGGGMGTVYRATAPDGRAVAVKFLSPLLAGTPELVARFAREVELLAGLDHPAIVRVLGQGEEGGVPWFAMELVEGEDLRARLLRGRLQRAETAAIFERLFEGLAHAHDRAIVHRDLKPANVLLAGDGARLADFGVARWEAERAGLPAATRLTETAAVIGTLPYMSPEQRRGGAVDRRSDLFSAGVMLYEALTGTLPQGAFPPPSELNRELPRAIDRLVLALLAPDPARRPGSAAEAKRLLLAALAPRARRRVVAGAGAAATAALAGVLALSGVWRSGGDGKQAVQKAVGPIPAPRMNLPPAPPIEPPAPAPQPPQAAAPRSQAAAFTKNADVQSLAQPKAPAVSKRAAKVVAPAPTRMATLIVVEPEARKSAGKKAKAAKPAPELPGLLDDSKNAAPTQAVFRK